MLQFKKIILCAIVIIELSEVDWELGCLWFRWFIVHQSNIIYTKCGTKQRSEEERNREEKMCIDVIEFLEGVFRKQWDFAVGNMRILSTFPSTMKGTTFPIRFIYVWICTERTEYTGRLVGYPYMCVRLHWWIHGPLRRVSLLNKGGN